VTDALTGDRHFEQAGFAALLKWGAHRGIEPEPSQWAGGLCHGISSRFASDNGGAIPSNLLQIPNTESNSPYLRRCATIGVKPHPARFPEKLPTFFIEFLTDPGDTVLDIFAGSNTTGSAAEKLDRHTGWPSRRTAATSPRPRSALWTNSPQRVWPRSGTDCTRTSCRWK
jgi:hypothetical protein